MVIGYLLSWPLECEAEREGEFVMYVCAWGNVF